MTKKLQTLKGFRDFLPEQMRQRQYAAGVIMQTFELFGFEPLETPALEYADVLLGKYGEEADKLVYTFEDKGGRKVGLRYDQTVPTARVLAQYQDLPQPFKRYQIQPVWRAEKPQAGRFREFLQCDIDILGSTSPLADAEIVATTYLALKNLGFKKVKALVNDREILFNLIQAAGISEGKKYSVIQTIDKLGKKTEAEIKKELEEKDLNPQQINKLFSAIEKAEPTPRLKQVLDSAEKLGATKVEFRPFLARGLDYYTSIIFEFMIEGYEAGAVAGGGRYDQLIKQLGGPDIPATGIAFGFDRIIAAMEQFHLFPQQPATAEVLITVFDTKLLSESIRLANQLRDKEISTEIYPDTETKLEKQIKYADKKKIPWVVILGPEEVKTNSLTLKNMVNGKQEKISVEELIKTLTH